MDKHTRMAELREEAETLAASVCAPGARVVHGEGSQDSPLVILGEAPGAAEERLARPFVGPAGEYLRRELLAAGIDPAGAYITNAVKCRPVRAGARGARNRRPTKREVRAWSDLLLRELEIVAAEVILCLGEVAALALGCPAQRISQQRGQWSMSPIGARVLQTFHPAFVRRSPSETRRLFAEDLGQAARALEPRSSCSG